VTSGRGFLATLCRSVNSEGERRCTSHRMEGISLVSLSLSEGFILCAVRGWGVLRRSVGLIPNFGEEGIETEYNACSKNSQK
jgi:hypothetical protein